MSTRSLLQTYMDRHAMSVREFAELVPCAPKDVYAPTAEVEKRLRELMKDDIQFTDSHRV